MQVKKGYDSMNNKKLIAGGMMAATLIGGSVFGVNAYASSNNNVDGLASKIATKFNISKDEVQKVIEDDHASHEAERQKEMLSRMEQRLNQAVKDGKLTEAQKTKILDYVKTQQTFVDSLKDKTDEERKTAMKQHRSEVQKWAKDNGIDEKYVMMIRPGGGPGRHGMMDNDNKSDGAVNTDTSSN